MYEYGAIIVSKFASFTNGHFLNWRSGFAKSFFWVLVGKQSGLMSASIFERWNKGVNLTQGLIPFKRLIGKTYPFWAELKRHEVKKKEKVLG